MNNIQVKERQSELPSELIKTAIRRYDDLIASETALKSGHWMQLCQSSSELTKSILEWTSKETGKPMCDLSIHLITGSIPTHTDKQSRACYIFPIRVLSDNVFSVRGEKVQLDNKHYYVFSDYMRHGFKNPANNLTVLLIANAKE